jgi:signal transduction histidine kinase
VTPPGRTRIRHHLCISPCPLRLPRPTPEETRIPDRHEIDGASRAAYARVVRPLILARLRLGAVIGFAGESGALVVNLVWAPDLLPQRVAALGAQALLSLLALWFATRRRASRHTTAFVAAYNIAIGTILLYQLTLSPTDVDALTAPVTWLMIGSMLLYPWGAVAQATVSGVLLLAYGAIVGPSVAGPGMRAANLVLGLGIGAVLSVIGAAVLERSRRAEFTERQRVRALAVQRRRLIDVGRALRTTLDFAEVKERLVSEAVRLIPAQTVGLVLRTQPRGGSRMVAAIGDATRFLDIDWEPDAVEAFSRAFAPAEVREWPGGPLDAVFGRPVDTRRVLFAAIGPQPEPIGFLAWRRDASEPFTRGERLAAQGIADQAHTAIGAARLYEAAARASRLKSEFVSTMSHELRTPLNVIMGYSQILSEVTPCRPESEQALDAVRRASVELLDLVEATLDLGRLEAGTERVDEQTVAVGELFDELASEFAAVPRAAGVKLQWDSGATLSLSTDRRKLKTILKNLVGNALKFTPAGSVRVECRQHGEQIRLRVADTGIGIRAEDQAVIFEMFRQADSSDSRRYGGTGLGLYIVRRLVQLLGGSVGLESSPGQGSIFTVTLGLRGVAGSRHRPAA